MARLGRGPGVEAVRRAARRVRHAAVTAWLSLGNAVECPCCGGTFWRFLGAGHWKRPNVECPRCGSRERQRLLWLYFQSHLDLLAGRLLHFAPEKGLYARLASLPGLDYVTADLDSPLAQHEVDIQSLPFEDGSFDALVCSHVLEHVGDDRRAMRELFRVLRPGGHAVVLVPTHGGLEQTLDDPEIATREQRLRTYGHPEHLRLYGRDFGARLAEAGFDVEAVDHAATLDDETRSRYRLGGDTIFIGRR